MQGVQELQERLQNVVSLSRSFGKGKGDEPLFVGSTIETQRRPNCNPIRHKWTPQPAIGKGVIVWWQWPRASLGSEPALSELHAGRDQGRGLAHVGGAEFEEQLVADRGGSAVDDVEAAGGIGSAVVERRVHDAGSQAEQ